MDYVIASQVNTYPRWVDYGNRFFESYWGVAFYMIIVGIVVFFAYKLDFSTITSAVKDTFTQPYSYTPYTSTTLDKVKTKGPTLILGLTGLLIFIGIVLYFVNYIRYYFINDTTLIDGISNARNRKLYDRKKLPISENQSKGIEFAYGMWIKIDDWYYNRQRNKYILVKGDLDDTNRIKTFAPSIYMTTNNTLRVEMQTFSSVAVEYAELPDIPLKKWFHLLVGVQGKFLDIYINGVLAKRKVLDGIPRQNNGIVYINPAINDNGNVTDPGFGGLIGDLIYYRYFPSQAALVRIVQNPPKEDAKPCDG